MVFSIKEPFARSTPATNRALNVPVGNQAASKYRQLQALLDSPDGKQVRAFLAAHPTPGVFARLGSPRHIVDLSPAVDERFRYVLALSERGPQLLNRDSGAPAFSAGTAIRRLSWLSGEERLHPALASIDVASVKSALARHAKYLRQPQNYTALERSYLFRTSFRAEM